ncbi:MAG: histidinol-phosphate transaminase [Burkholderiales bacterium]|nr:histidinol-phosphate transaminase [Burkholderiales bacterium]
MNYADLAPAYVRAIAPYQPGKPISEVARELGIPERDIIKLASNENPLGCGEAAKAAMRRAIEEAHLYPDGAAFELRAALSRKWGVPMEAIVAGNGSNDLLDYIAMAYLAPGVSAVYAQHCFAVYPITVLARGATGIKVPAKAYGNDLDAMAAAIRPDTRMVFIANPNNPTGTFSPYAQIRAFMERVPAEVIVVLDEAYNDFLPPELREDTVAWLKDFPNLVLTRTFCKIYGLAGLRVGYMLADPQVCDMVNRVRAPFNVNAIAQAAAVAALDDHDFVRRTYENNRAGMAQLVDGVKALGLDYIPSYGNFVTVDVGDGAKVFNALLRRGVIVRPIAGYELPRHVRVTIGLPHENARFLASLAEALAEVGRG